VKALRSALAGAALGVALGGCQTTTNGTEQSDAAAARANMQLGSAYLQQGNLPVAKDKLERAVKQAPRDPAIHGLLAMLYLRLGEESRAEGEYRAALALAPRDPDLLNNYAVFLCGAGRIDEGVARFQEAARNPLYRTPWPTRMRACACTVPGAMQRPSPCMRAHCRCNPTTPRPPRSWSSCCSPRIAPPTPTAA